MEMNKLAATKAESVRSIPIIRHLNTALQQTLDASGILSMKYNQHASKGALMNNKIVACAHTSVWFCPMKLHLRIGKLMKKAGCSPLINQLTFVIQTGY